MSTTEKTTTKATNNAKAATAKKPTIEELDFAEVGENVLIATDGNWCYVAFELNHRGGFSSSGKTVTVASTKGNKVVEGTTVILGVNAYVKP